MAEVDELKKQVRESVANVVQSVMADFVSRLTRTATKRTLKKLTERLKEKAIHKLETYLRDISRQGLEGQLDKGAQQIANQLDKSIGDAVEKLTLDSFEGVDFVRGIEKGLKKSFKKPLSSPIKPVLITCATVAIIGGGVWAAGNSPPESIPPQVPQPDIVITEVWEELTERGTIIHYFIANQGDREAGPSLTRLYHNNEVIGEDAVSPLQPGQSVERAFIEFPLPEIVLEVELRADDGDSIEEIDEDNNYRWYELSSTPPPPPPVAPAAPTGLEATFVSASRVDLNWTDNANNEAGFRIQRSTNGGFTFAEIGTVPGNATAFSDTDVTADSEYVYRVYAFNDAGNSEPSNSVTALTPIR